MNLALLTQDAMLVGCPTVADVVAGTHVVTGSTVTLLRRDPEEWKAFGPFPVQDIEWGRLDPKMRVYEGA